MNLQEAIVITAVALIVMAIALYFTSDLSKQLKQKQSKMLFQSDFAFFAFC